MKKMKFGDGYTIFENGDIYNKFNKKLTPADNGSGYLIVNVKINNILTCKSIHRLLGENFLENKFNYSDINHKDGNRRNNNLENLEWCSHGDNIKHSYLLGNRSAVGTNNANCKYNEEIVIEICILLSKNIKSSLIRDMGYPYDLVRKIKSRRTWKHISSSYIF